VHPRVSVFAGTGCVMFGQRNPISTPNWLANMPVGSLNNAVRLKVTALRDGGLSSNSTPVLSACFHGSVRWRSH
jgi:hypothetical protein